MSEINGRIALLKAAAGLAAASVAVTFAGLVAFSAAQAHTPVDTRLTSQTASVPSAMLSSVADPSEFAEMSDLSLMSRLEESQRVLAGLRPALRPSSVIQAELDRILTSAHSSPRIVLGLANEFNNALSWECITSHIAAIRSEQVRRRSN